MDGAVAGYREFLDFFRNEYLPNARTTLGASELPNGRAYYALKIREFTTLDLTPEEIHKIGLSEVERISGEMNAVMKQAGFKGDFAAFLVFLRTDPRFYAKTPEELLSRASRIAKRIDGKLPSLFKTLPRLPYTVEPVPADIAPKYTSGRYVGAAQGSTQPGIYWVNTYMLESRPLYNLEALTLHEAVPGHHLQISLSRELGDLPNFRRFSYISAFGEGWGLYCEWLGIEAGIYQRSVFELRPADVRDVARLPPRRRHRHPLDGLDAPAGHRLPGHAHRAAAARSGDGSRPLHFVAGPGARVQTRRAEDQGAAQTRRGSARARASTSASSTTSSSAAARCRCSVLEANVDRWIDAQRKTQMTRILCSIGVPVPRRLRDVVEAAERRLPRQRHRAAIRSRQSVDARRGRAGPASSATITPSSSSRSSFRSERRRRTTRPAPRS